MIEDDYFKVQRSFVFDLVNLSEVAVKLYLILRQAVNEKRNDGNLVFPSYSFIQKVTGMSNKSIKKAQDELIERGWIDRVEKGFNKVNQYYLNDVQGSFQNILPDDVVSESTPDSFQKKPQVVSEGNKGSFQKKHKVVSKVETNKNNITKRNNKNNTNNNKLTSEILPDESENKKIDTVLSSEPHNNFPDMETLDKMFSNDPNLKTPRDYIEEIEKIRNDIEKTGKWFDFRGECYRQENHIFGWFTNDFYDTTDLHKLSRTLKFYKNYHFETEKENNTSLPMETKEEITATDDSEETLKKYLLDLYKEDNFTNPLVEDIFNYTVKNYSFSDSKEILRCLKDRIQRQYQATEHQSNWFKDVFMSKNWTKLEQ